MNCMRCILILSLIVVVVNVRAATISVVASGGDLVLPFGIAFDSAGNLYSPLLNKNCILRIDSEGKQHLFAGTGKAGFAGDGGPAEKAQLNFIHNCITLGDALLVADTGNASVRKVDFKTHTITTIAGVGKKGFSGDGGPALKAEFGGVFCLALDAEGKRLFVCDLDNRRIRAVDLQNGIATNFAGNGKRGLPVDGAAASESPLVDPRAVACDSKNNVYILERGGHALRVVDASGKIHTVVGTGKKGPAAPGTVDGLQATLNGPKHLCCDRDTNVIIADTDNHVIRRYSPKTGKVETIVGSKLGSAPITPGMALLDVTLSQPHGVYVDGEGVLFIADSYNNRILKVSR